MTNNNFTFFLTGTFSQWHRAEFDIQGIYFTCAEQWMMFVKALVFNDQEIAQQILEAKTPYTHKLLGRRIKNYDDKVWCACAKDVVYWGNFAKFTQNPDLLSELLATEGTELVEASQKDSRWGIGLHEFDSKAQSKDTWNGENWLGETITKVRDDILNLNVKPIAEWVVSLINIRTPLKESGSPEKTISELIEG